MKRSSIIAIPILLGCTTAMAAAPDGVTMRKALAEGVESYHADLKMDMSMDVAGQPSDTTFTSTIHYAFKNGKPTVDGATAPCELTTTVEKMDATGIMGQFLDAGKDAAMKPVTIKGNLNNLGRFTADKVAANPTAMMLGNSTSSMQTFVEFPDKAVNIGDTWDVTIPKGPLTGAVDQKLTAKYIGDKDVDGKSVYVLSLTGTLKTDIDTSNLPKPETTDGGAAAIMANMKILIHGTSDITEEALVDKATGKTLKNTMTVKTKQSIEIPDQGDIKIDMNGTSKATLTADK